MSKSKSASKRMGNAHSQQRGVSRLAGKWEREGHQMIKLADAEPSVEGDMALRNAGAARLKCAKELRAVVGHGDSVTIEVIQAAVNKLKVPESCEGKMRGEYLKCGMRLAVEAINAAIAEHKRAARLPNS